MALAKRWLFLLLILTFSSANAAPLTDCARLLVGPSNSAQTASETLNELIRQRLTELGLEVSVQTQPNMFTRWRASKLLAQVDETLFSNENFRNQWVDKVVSLKIDENIDLLDQVKNPISDGQRLALRRLLLRSLIQRGFADKSDGVESKSSWGEVVRQIRSHPVFRLIFLWQLPRQTITLTDDQMVELIQSGEPVLETNLALTQSISRDERETRKRKMNSLAAATIGVLMTAYAGWSIYPDVVSSYDQGHALAVQENTQAYVNRVNGFSQMNSDAITLNMATSELHILTQDFIKRFGQEPTPSEAQELRIHVCKIRYGDILSPDSQFRCMSLP